MWFEKNLLPYHLCFVCLFVCLSVCSFFKNLVLHSLAPSTLAVGHWWWLAKDVCPACCFQLRWLHSLCHLLVDLRRSSWGVIWIFFLVLVATWLALTLYTLQPFYNVLQNHMAIVDWVLHVVEFLPFSLPYGFLKTFWKVRIEFLPFALPCDVFEK